MNDGERAGWTRHKGCRIFVCRAAPGTGGGWVYRIHRGPFEDLRSPVPFSTAGEARNAAEDTIDRSEFL
jgi:hypothetical protein